jgi:ABC-type polysaccharide/polyol phosphate transport system ATPase subunit
MEVVPAIAARNVGVRYDLRMTPDRTIRRAAAAWVREIGRRKSTRFWALEDVSFVVEPGDILGIIGANGSGKSTLLLAIAGVLRPDAGMIYASGRPTLLTIAAPFETELTGRQNIFLNAAYLGFGRKEISGRVDEIIAFSELGSFIDVPVRKYSAGMRTRLAFAVASHLEPDVLLLDEILGVGDEAFREKSSKKMRSLIEGAKAIVVVTHNMGFVKQMCTKALWLEDGRVAGYGEPAEIVNQYVERSKVSRPAVRSASPAPPPAEPRAAAS